MNRHDNRQDNMRKRGGAARSMAGAWRRLKVAVESELDSIGLPSKGDNRLLDHKIQERYYEKIVQRYMNFWADAGECDELLRRMALDIPETPPSSEARPPKSSPARPSSPDKEQHMADILFSLRKLREGVVASNRMDEFAAKVYMFCIKVAIMARHPPTYYPAILHVMRRFQPIGLLSSIETSEVATYLVLDAACRRHNLAEAYTLRGRHGPKNDDRLDAVLAALAHDNYVAFRRAKAGADGYKAKLMECADEEMRLATLKTVGRAYMSVGLPFLEEHTGQKWLELKKGGVGWELKENNVITRKPRQPVSSSG